MQVAQRLERKLAAEGLAPIDGEARSGREHGRAWTADELQAAAAAVDAWMEWARGVVIPFPAGRRETAVWNAYAGGKSYSEIEAATGIGRRDISRIVDKIEAAVPPPPCPNPWRKSGRAVRAATLADVAEQSNPRVTARLLELAMACADTEALARLVAADAQLHTLTEGANVAEAVKRAVVEVEYTRIVLKRLEVQKSPMNQAKQLAVLLPAEFGGKLVGRPHAGGIDVFYEQAGERKCLTVPWWKIDSAERAVEAA